MILRHHQAHVIEAKRLASDENGISEAIGIKSALGQVAIECLQMGSVLAV